MKKERRKKKVYIFRKKVSKIFILNKKMSINVIDDVMIHYLRFFKSLNHKKQKNK